MRWVRWESPGVVCLAAVWLVVGTADRTAAAQPSVIKAACPGKDFSLVLQSGGRWVSARDEKAVIVDAAGKPLRLQVRFDSDVKEP